MSEETRSVIALIIGGIVFISGYIRLFFKTNNEKFIEKAKKNGYFVTGTLIKSKTYFGDRSDGKYEPDTEKCIYEYSINGKSYKKKFFFDLGESPYTITVYYDPNRPFKRIAGEEARNYNKGCCGTVIFASLTYILVLNVLKLF